MCDECCCWELGNVERRGDLVGLGILCCTCPEEDVVGGVFEIGYYGLC